MPIFYNRIRSASALIFLLFVSFNALSQTIPITGDGTMEYNQEKTYSVNAGGNSVYWIIDGDGGYIKSGQGTSQILVKAITGANFNIRVQLNNGSAGIGGKEITVTPIVPDTPTISYSNCLPILTRGNTWSCWHGNQFTC